MLYITARASCGDTMSIQPMTFGCKLHSLNPTWGVNARLLIVASTKPRVDTYHTTTTASDLMAPIAHQVMPIPFHPSPLLKINTTDL